MKDQLNNITQIKETTITMTTSALDQHIAIQARAQAEKLALVKFTEWKESYLAEFNLDGSFLTLSEIPESKPKNQVAQVHTVSSVLNLNDSKRIKQVYKAIVDGVRVDRHQVLEAVIKANGNEVSVGTINGRMGELLDSGLIVEAGCHEGKFGKRVALYSAVL